MEEKKELTVWGHMKKNNYHWLALGFILGGSFMLYDIEPEVKWISIFPFLIGVVVIPLGNYFSWKSKFGKK